MYKFEKLIVWKKAMVLIKGCYKITRALPSHEKYGLASQINRSAVSVAANIAEGSGAGTDREFRRYLLIARKSLFETVTLLKICNEVYSSQDLQETLGLCNEVGMLLSGLIKKLNSID